MTSCEAELQELMRQIDIMVHNRKMEWETELEGVKGQLRSSDKEVMSQRALLEVNHQEVCSKNNGTCFSKRIIPSKP